MWKTKKSTLYEEWIKIKADLLVFMKLNKDLQKELDNIKSVEREFKWNVIIEILNTKTGVIRSYKERYCGTKEQYEAHRKTVESFFNHQSNVFMMSIEGELACFYKISDDEMFSKFYINTVI